MATSSARMEKKEISMAEQKYESKIASSTSSAQDIYRVMSDLTNIEKVKNLIPQDKVKEIVAVRARSNMHSYPAHKALRHE